MSNGPTPEQIKQVQSNLATMQHFNDFVYNYGQHKVTNAYLLLSEDDNKDPGLNVCLNLLEGVFRGVGAMFGPVGAFVSTFVGGLVASWASAPPPSLNTTFSRLLDRLYATSVAVDTQLATYYQDVKDNWSVKFTSDGQTRALSDLATFTFPAETDPDYETLAKAAIVALDKQIWQTVLQANYVVTHWIHAREIIFSGNKDNPPVEWDKAYIASNPAFYNTWGWHDGQGCGDESGWVIDEYNIGTGVTSWHDGSLNNDACAYLFFDSADGVVINKDGLFPRKTIFTGLGIRVVEYFVPKGAGGATQEKLSGSYLRAMKEGRTLGLLIQREGREQVEKRVVEHAQQDSVFAVELATRPRQALEKFLGVKIPEVVSINVIVEGPRTYGLVVPKAKFTG